MKLVAIFTIYLKEMLDTVRDRRTLMVMILMPMVFMPLITIGLPMLGQQQMTKEEERIADIGVVGGDNSPSLMAYLDLGANSSRVTLIAVENLTAAICDKKVKAGILIEQDFDRQVEKGEMGNVSIYYESTDLTSQTARDKVLSMLQGYRMEVVAQRLSASDLNISILTPFVSTWVDVSTEEEKGGFFLALILPMLLGMFAAVGGMYTAIDVTAGEKERNTLERLLVTPVSRMEIVLGKFLAVFTVSMVSVGMLMFSMIISVVTAGSVLFSEESFVINIPLMTIVVILLMAGLLAVMINSIEIAVCIFAKSFKEAQNYVTPITFIVIMPAVMTMMMPAMEAEPIMFLVPLVSALLIFKEALLGSFIWEHIVLAVASSALYAVIALLIAAKLFSRESVLFRGGG